MENLKEKEEEFLKSLLGIDLSKASKICLDVGYVFRVTREDENRYFVTADLRFDRVNFEIDNGIITSANIG